jgi:elongation factor G
MVDDIHTQPPQIEPIMKVEVVTSKDHIGVVIGDLNARRGQIQRQDMRGNTSVIDAMVPLANMSGYVDTLHAMSQGSATFAMQFDHYAPAPWPDGDPPSRPATGMHT